jgi:integrase
LKTSFAITTNERQSYGGGWVKGTTYKRCKCPPRFNAAGKRLACPKKHGRWAYALAVPLSDEGRVTLGRPQVTRSGFATQEAARAELRQVIQLLEIPDADDDEGRMEIAEMIRDAYRRYRQLPEYDDVRRRFAAGVSLVRHQTTGEWLDEWLAGKRRVARNTHRSYEGHIRLHLKPYLGQIPLKKLRRAHIRAAYDKTMAANATRDRVVGAATIQRVHATLRKALNDAVTEGRITDNPARYVELESAKRPRPVVWTSERVIEWMRTGERPKVVVWTPAQAGAFLDFAADDRLYAYYHLLIFRGPRRGEGVGLRWPNLDLDGAVMDVSEQIIQVGWETEVTTPKSDSDGLVALDATTVAVLRAHRRQQLAERLAWGAAWADTGYVFTTETGQPIHPDYVSRHFVRLVRHANQLKLGSKGQAVEDVQRALCVEPSGLYGQDTRRAVFEYQRGHEGLTPNGIVDPNAWYQLFPDQPLRPYPHPGCLPPIRLHDLRHFAATLALTAGVDMKVVSQMLRHKTLSITADTYTSVVPEVARTAAEAAATIVPRQIQPKGAGGATSTSLAPGPKNPTGRSSRWVKAQVSTGAPPGTRTPNPRIKSPQL